MEATVLARAPRRSTTVSAKTRRKPAMAKPKPKPKPKPKRAQAERMVTVKTASKTTPMSFRIDEATRDLVDRAATVVGQNRTDFMLTVLREKATEVLLNQRLFTLNESDWDAFVERLDDPPPPNAKLKALLSRVPIWDK